MQDFLFGLPAIENIHPFAFHRVRFFLRVKKVSGTFLRAPAIPHRVFQCESPNGF
jgi:hypothetical protein